MDAFGAGEGGEMSKCACMSDVRDPQNRSKRKCCICGGHNHKNVKRNKHHNGTRVKLLYRKLRRGRIAERLADEAEGKL